MVSVAAAVKGLAQMKLDRVALEVLLMALVREVNAPVREWLLVQMVHLVRKI